MSTHEAGVRLAASLAVLLAVGASLWYVTAPPKGRDGYMERGAQTAATIRSQVQTTRIALGALADGKLPHAAALVGFEESERDARSAASKFETFEPPSGTSRFRAQLVGLAGEATDVLSAIRIAAQQESWQHVLELGQPLPRLAARLERFRRRQVP